MTATSTTGYPFEGYDGTDESFDMLVNGPLPAQTTPNYTGTPDVLETIVYFNGMSCTLYVQDTMPVKHPKSPV